MSDRRDERLLKAFIFSFFMTSAVTVSYLPLYFDAKGYSKIQIGLLYSLGPMIGIFSNLIWGIASDRFRTVKKMLITVLVGQLLLIAILLKTDTFTALFMVMMFFFFFSTPTSPLSDSLTLLTIRKNNKSYSSFRVWGSFGFAFSALLIGMLLKAHGSSLTIPVMMTTITITLLVSFTLKDHQADYKKPDFSGLVKVISSKKLLWFLLFVFTMSVAHRANDGFLGLYMRELGATDDLIGWAWVAAAISEIPVFFYLSKYGHKYKELPMLAAASAAYVLRFFLISITTDPIWIVGIQTLHSVTYGIYLITAVRYLQQLVPDEYRATGQAVLAVTWAGFAGLIGGSAGGLIYDAWGPHMMYRSAAAMSLLACCGFLATHWFSRENRSSRES